MLSQEKYVLLKNRQGEELSVVLDGYREGDEADMIACIKEEYGETYFKRNFYDPAYLREEAKNGHIVFLTARALPEREIAGMMILKNFFPQESMCEIASQIFRKKYRGYGMANVFFGYGIDLLRTGAYSAAYCLPVLFHDMTQRLLQRRGLRATGFVLNVFDMAGITHSYDRGRNEKHSQGIQIMALGKKNAGTVFIPKEHQQVSRGIYESLGVDFRILGKTTKDLPERTALWCGNDAAQQSLEIRVDTAGGDFASAMREVHSRYPFSGRQTANVFLNCSHDSALYASRILQDMGYFFTGLKPLCSEREYMVFHHPGRVEICFEDYAVSEEFGRLLGYVRECFRRRQKKI